MRNIKVIGMKDIKVHDSRGTPSVFRPLLALYLFIGPDWSRLECPDGMILPMGPYSGQRLMNGSTWHGEYVNGHKHIAGPSGGYCKADGCNFFLCYGIWAERV